MTVWILTCLADDRGGAVVGVYATEQLAGEALASIMGEPGTGFSLSDYEITEHKVEEYVSSA